MPDSQTTPLEDVIRQRILHAGPITFAEFMQHALYDPNFGYYRTSRNVVGVGGDFITSVSATPMFGRMLVQVIDHYVRQLGIAPVRDIHEFGAHRGQLRSDILAASPEVTYHTYENRDEWPSRIRGCVIANELLDALPFHQLQVVNGRWLERYVSITDGELQWVTGPVSRPELLEPLEGLPVEYMEGYITEVSLEARRWLSELASRLESGLVLLFDYGHETEQYFAPHRADGGLRTFRKHERGDNPFLDLGERDITCDVNFSDVVATAQRVGLDLVEFTDQGRLFSRQVARILREHLPQGDAPGETPFTTTFTQDEVRGLMTLTHPSHLGLAFKVVVLRK